MSEETATEKAETALIGRVLADRYRVERLLGSGGMGSVYRAEHVLMKKAVALKVLHREMTYHPEVVARFEREAVAAARIDHPNVAAAMDCGKLEDGSFYIVLEYVDGKSLRALIDEGPIALDRALGIAAQMSEGLAAAHAAGIVHRDLKPDNVMLVTQGGNQDFAKILDFGIAKVDGPEGTPESQRALTRIGAVMGTAGYMSPEQALGQSVDQRADMYAFGVVLYEMVAGRMPYVAEEAAQILAKQLTEPPAPLPGAAPAGLTSLIDKLLEKTPDNRVQSAAELSTEITRLRSALGPGGSSTVLDLDGGGMPKSARTSPSTDDSAATLDVADGKKADSTGSSNRRRAIVAGAILAVVLGGAVFWGTRKDQNPTSAFTLSSATAALLSSLPPLPAAGPSASAEPEVEPPPSATASRTEGPGTAPTSSSSTRTTFSETKSTKTDGNTTTTKRTTRKSTVSEKKTVERKRRTGPGGIYIPPPSQWFK
jgi:serine/threonine protein kinase